MEETTQKQAKSKGPFYNRVESEVMATCLAIMSVVTFVNVITRYFFSFTFSWAEQLTRILFVWLTFSGISYAGLKSAHLKVTAIQQFMPAKIGRVILLVGDLVTVVFGFIASYYIYIIVLTIIRRGQTFPSMPWMPAWFMYIPGVFFMFTFALRVIQSSVIPNIREMTRRY